MRRCIRGRRSFRIHSGTIWRAEQHIVKSPEDLGLRLTKDMLEIDICHEKKGRKNAPKLNAVV